MDLQGEGVRDMRDPDSGRVAECEWHEGYDEDDCQPCQAAWEAWEDRREMMWRERTI
jgi:hypothetical protein